MLSQNVKSPNQMNLTIIRIKQGMFVFLCHFHAAEKLCGVGSRIMKIYVEIEKYMDM